MSETSLPALPRRQLIRTGALAAGLVMPAVIIGRSLGAEQQKRSKKIAETKENVTPPEDLMREHGVLDRVLLIYEAALRRFSANEDFDPAVLTDSAHIIREFIEDYHEKSEEEHVFPHFKKAGIMTDLVDTLLAQHKAGRQVTEAILSYVPGSREEGDERRKLVNALTSFITMYRPHAAREDTDLFPKLRDLVSVNEYDAMAEEFEEKEHKLFGVGIY